MTDQNENEEVVTGTIMMVDQRTQQPISRGANTETQIQQANLDLNKIGTLQISPKAAQVLDEPLNEKDVLIRPDGLVYVDWTWYADRLNRAFGKAQWGLIPQGNAMSKQNGNYVDIIWPHWLVIKGIPMGMAVGECTYNPKNFTMSYTDALEGAKSISLSRNCKVFGMTLELWNKEWIEAWKAKHAETYPNPRKPNEVLWRKRTIDPIKEGKRKLLNELKDWYPTAQDVVVGFAALNITAYTVEEHDQIRKKMIDYAYQQEQAKE